MTILAVFNMNFCILLKTRIRNLVKNTNVKDVIFKLKMVIYVKFFGIWKENINNIQRNKKLKMDIVKNDKINNVY